MVKYVLYMVLYIVKLRATGRHARLFSLIQLCSSFFAKQNKHMPILPPQVLFFFLLKFCFSSN